ncbi:MAG: phage tail protein [Methylobacter sp.]
MTNIMMRLGKFNFSINTAAYQQFNRSTAYRWQAQERFGQLPAQQYTGPGEDSITLSGEIYPDYAGGIHQIDDMRTEAEKGLPLLLVDGNGYVWRYWCIQSIEDAREVFLSNGMARKMTFNMKLTRYGEET